MDKFIIVVHGGAGPSTNFILDNQKAIVAGLEEAIEKGYEILKNRGKAIEAVEAAVNALEDNPLLMQEGVRHSQQKQKLRCAPPSWTGVILIQELLP